MDLSTHINVGHAHTSYETVATPSDHDHDPPDTGVDGKDAMKTNKKTEASADASIPVGSHVVAKVHSHPQPQDKSHARSNSQHHHSSQSRSGPTLSHPSREETLRSVARVLHRHVLFSHAEQKERDRAASIMARAMTSGSRMTTPRRGSGATGWSSAASSVASTPRHPSSSFSSFDRCPSPASACTHAHGHGVTSTPTSSLASPSFGSPYSSLEVTTPSWVSALALEHDSSPPHPYHEDIFDIDHYLKRSYQVQMPILAHVAPMTPVVQRRQYHHLPLPSSDHIYAFIKRLMEQAKLNAECIIICLIYIERIMDTRGLVLTSRNWIPFVTTALLAASKVWDDHASYNAEFAAILPIFTLQQINALERTFLTIISYELYISAQVYASFFFGLRSIRTIKHDRDIPRHYHATYTGHGVHWQVSPLHCCSICTC